MRLEDYPLSRLTSKTYKIVNVKTEDFDIIAYL